MRKAKSKLIQRAEEIESTLPISELEREGFVRDKRKYEYIVAYPPMPAMSLLSQDELLSGEARDRDMHFYIHLPFCTGTCTYCGRFEKFAGLGEQVVDDYIYHLLKELDLIARIPELNRMRIRTLYFGGGTPTYLSVQQARRLDSGINSILDLSECVERTRESSPETITEEKLEELKEQGTDRISIGHQSYDDRVLKACNRRHNAATAVEKAKLVKEAGFDNFNIDLISGLPYQTLDVFEKDLRMAFECCPSCITIYPLYLRPGCKMSSMPEEAFPSRRENLLMQIMAKEFFKDRDYVEGPVHFFAKRGTVSQHQNQHKWGRGAECIGLGVSIYQFLNNTQYHNFFDMERYRRAVDSGRLPIWIGKKLGREEQMARLMILGLKKGVVDIGLFYSRFGEHPETIYPKKIRKLKDLGLVVNTTDEHEKIDEFGYLALTPLGDLYSEEVARQFYTEETRKAIGDKGYAGFSLAELPKI